MTDQNILSEELKEELRRKTREAKENKQRSVTPDGV